MGIHFNADEVFSMAIKIEENGAAFYRRAAALHRQNQYATIFESLAKMEDGHKRTFEEMRRTLPESYKAEESHDPYEEAALYLDALADGHGGEGSLSIADKLTGKESFDEILDIAVDLEKKSILYYLGLRDLVPVRLGQEKIDKIIAEEKKHVVQLKEIRARNR